MPRIVAIVAAFNEEDIISQVIGALIAQGVEVYLIDNCSTDRTVSEALPWLNKGLLHVERFPDDSGYAVRSRREYVWTDILKRKQELARELEADWFIHHDADEFRESPLPFLTLAQAIGIVDRLGYNALDFNLINFRPVNDDYREGMDVRQSLCFYQGAEEFNQLQVKVWKNLRVPVDLVASGGHDVQFDGRRVFPVKFLLRHYPIRSQSHGVKKVLAERKARFCADERARGWHVQYDDISDADHNFLHDANSLYRFNLFTTKLRLMSLQAFNKLRKILKGEG